MSQIGNNRNTDKFVVRLPHELRERISDIARINHRSLNAEIIHLIEQSLDGNPQASAQANQVGIDLDVVEGRLTGLIQQFITALKAPSKTHDLVDHGESPTTDQLQALAPIDEAPEQDIPLNQDEVPTQGLASSNEWPNKRATLALGEHLSEELDQWINDINIDHLIGTLKNHLHSQDQATQQMLTDVLVLWRSSELSMLHSLDEASHSISRQIDVIEQCIKECKQQVGDSSTK